MASAEIFSQTNNQFIDNNTIDLNIDNLKMFDSLECNGGGGSGGSGGSDADGGSDGVGTGAIDGVVENDCENCDDDADHGSLEDDESLSDNKHPEQDCRICKKSFVSPRVLSCLHVFCEGCLDKLLIDEAGDTTKINCTIICPDCKQPTKVGISGASTLHQDYVFTNIFDLNAVEPGAIACTACTSKENAISRCNECANFLCSACDNAHKYMRCFENHTVVLLSDLRNSTEKVAIHKPLYCTIHTSEIVKYYCFNCQLVVCPDCLNVEHKMREHHYELIADVEKRMRSEIEDLMVNANNKVQYCDVASGNLGNSLNELQSQHDMARDIINENYEGFKKILEQCQEDALKELEQLHSERELKIMDLMHSVEKSMEKIDSAVKFTEKVLEQANGAELLSLKRLIAVQLIKLVNTAPQVDIHFSLQFDSKYKTFEALAQDAFGKFRTESTPCPKESTPPPTLPGMLNKTNGTCNSSQGALTGSVTASSPISLPTSMQSSFDGDMSVIGNNNFMMPSNVLSPDSPQLMGNSMTVNGQSSAVVPTGNNMVSGLSSIAEYNLHRLANLADNVVVNDMTDSIVRSTNPSPSPQFTLADLISGDQRAFNSLQALAKLGLNNNGNNLLARGPSPGMDNVTGLLNDYMAQPTSPIGSSINDDMSGMGCGGGGVGNGGGSLLSANALNQPGRTKATAMQIRCKFGSLGTSKAQFNSPHGFCLGVEEEIIVADTNNHRIEVFDKAGAFKFQFGVPGKEEGQLWYPRKVAVMRTNSKFVVCDRGNERSRMQIFTKNGHFIKKIAIRYIDIVAGLAVTNQGHIVAVDSVSPTVFIISEDGDLVHWFDCSDYMREPSDIAISGSDFYVCDFKGHCVAVFKDDGTFQYRIGHEKTTCFPNGIDISDAGDVLIGDSHGNRFHVACFSREGVLQSEFECPYVKVSRCCGLKITSEGYVVTLAKNNHHVLVLNTLYVP